MDKVSGRVQKASTHAGSVGVDIAIVERHCATVYVDATSILPNNGGTSVKASTPSGRWRNFQGEFQKASTHAGSVGVDIAVVERDCATVHGDATSLLPNNGSTLVKASTPSGP